MLFYEIQLGAAAIEATFFGNRTPKRASENTQWCKFMGKNLKFALESGADGEGKHARRRNQNRGAFHALPAP